MKDILKINKCLISVSDKSDIIKFAKNIVAKNIEIVSTGNTYKKLKQRGIKVKKVESITKFPEILDGRVKTLHPKIFGGILGDIKNPNHRRDMKRYDLNKFELVVVNFYPFEKVIKQTNNVEKCIENIDIGGPSMIRGAAKNYNSTTVVIEKEDYSQIIEQIKKYGGITSDLRKRLACKAFERTMQYDTKISMWMSKSLLEQEETNFFIAPRNPNKLRYGENPHQKASFYSTTKNKNLFFEKLNGKELSYNNLNDLKLGLK
ncbi:MAG: bifunctional phosphoribosylaminoimidazolecarboxamide formyltransferase/inosine monophosphate cyclohydrolase, partial [Pelagibacterales bacterium]|nr:bifunctional phosphoribosylaminoimidazolecarboxamide formyltransferase/inosine monophosphate cyclohydrolase [Pelagibacterales bacterium]